MDQAGEGALFVLILKNITGLAIGIARVDDQRQAGLASRCDMGAEADRLFLARAVLVVEIETGFADANHLGMACRLDQPIGGALPLLLRLMGMDAH